MADDGKTWMVLPLGRLRVSRLIKACAEGDVPAAARELANLEYTESSLADDADDWAGSTPLHWAAYAGSAPIVSALLAAKADPEQPNARYATTRSQRLAPHNWPHHFC